MIEQEEIKLKKVNILSFAKRYFVPFLALALIASVVVVSSVFAKYVSRSEQSIDITVEAYGEITLGLYEGASSATSWSAASQELFMAPGATIGFDPYVKVGANSETCYLFVRVAENAVNVTVDATQYGFDDFITYSVDSGWTQGDGTSIPADVYYRTVTKSGSDQYFRVITGDAVTVPDAVTEKILYEFNNASKPTLTVSAYAVQITNLTDPNRDNATAAGAWAWINAQ